MDNAHTLIDPRLNQIVDCLYRVASKAIIIRDRKILLVKEPEGWYGLPGGGIDHGQEPRESLLRELQEEIGAQIGMDAVKSEPLFVMVGGITAGIPRVTMYYSVAIDSAFTPIAKELKFIWADKDTVRNIALGPNIELARQKLQDLF